ncbi:NlpC/P60 family protein [Arthrobacter sp. NPDC089319]|uniref:C40 family peptidase n=1 Tax=Arthrobacter sp. NPDC089319 TaxID=3155915 RepID=UPI00342D1066
MRLLPSGRPAPHRSTTPIRAVALFSATALLVCVPALAPAVAAPAGQLPQVTSVRITLPVAPSLPSNDEIDDAKGDAAATQALVDRIEEQLQEASGNLANSEFDSMRLQNTYSESLLKQQERTAELDDAKAKASEAAEYFESVKNQVGQLAGELYRNGGVNPALSALLDSKDTSDVLYKASTLDALTANRSQTLTESQQAAQLWAAWELYVTQADEAAKDAAVAAEAAETDAKAASAAQEQQVIRYEEQRQTLLVHLAELRGTSTSEEDSRIAALEKAEQDRQLQALVEQSAQEAAAAQRPSSSKSTAQGSTVAPASDDVTPSRPSPPTTSRPATPSTPEPSRPSAPAPKPSTPPSTPAPTKPATPPARPTPPPEKPKPKPEPEPEVVTPPPVVGAPSVNGGIANAAISFARAKESNKKTFYDWGGVGPLGYDCSGLTQAAFGSAGRWLPRTAQAQLDQAPYKVPLSQLQPGDLVFWGEPNAIWHVAVYIGNWQVVHALNRDAGLTVTNISHMYGKLHTSGARWAV